MMDQLLVRLPVVAVAAFILSSVVKARLRFDHGIHGWDGQAGWRRRRGTLN